MPIFVVLEPANSNALWFWRAETYFNGSHSCQGPACPVCNNARGNLWELSTGNKIEIMLFIGCEEGFYLLATQLTRGHPQLLAGCWLDSTFSALSHGPSPNYYILYQNQQERVSFQDAAHNPM